MNEKVSIVVPIYNAERYLSECIDSLIYQTYQNIEIILVDDGSSDSSASICDSYAKCDTRIKVFHNGNHGVSYARNYGLDMASGLYIMFVDSDDTIETYAVETLVTEMKNEKADAVISGFNYLYGTNKIARAQRMTKGKYERKDYIEFLIDDGTCSGITFGSACASLYRKDIIDSENIRFCEKLKYYEDGLFNILYCSCADWVYYDANRIYNYRQWKNSSSTKYEVLCEQIALADAELKRILSERKINIFNLEEQLIYRKVSNLFQKSLSIANGDMPQKSLKLKQEWEKSDVTRLYQFINKQKLNRYKRCLWRIISLKQARLFVFLIKNVYPKIKSKIKR